MEELAWIDAQISELKKLLSLCEDSPIMRKSLECRIEEFEERKKELS